MDEARLDPAHQQLRPRHRTGEAADIVTHVERAGEAHAETRPQVPAQTLPARRIVAAPGLGIALNPRAAGARHREGPLAGFGPRLLFEGGTGHEQRLNWPGEIERDRTSESIADRILVPQLVFVVVVPGAVDAGGQHLLAQALLPPRDRRHVAEVEMRSLAVPELAQRRRAARPVLDETTGSGDLGEARVVVEQTGLQIGDDAHSRCLELRHQLLGHWELVAVPVEDIAALADHRVARAEMERADRDRLRR